MKLNRLVRYAKAYSIALAHMYNGARQDQQLMCILTLKIFCLNTFSTMKEGSPLSVLRCPMTAASVPSSITSASVKAKSIYTSLSRAQFHMLFFLRL
jgi:hypothetical protein